MRRLNEELKNALKIDVMPYRKDILSDSYVIHEHLEAGCQDDEIQQTHKEQILSVVRSMQAIQRPGKRISFFEFLLRQIPFIGKDIWMTQGFAALAMFGLLYLTTQGNLEYLSIRHIPLLVGILAIVLVMTSIPLVLRSYRYGMYEIEMAARISFPRLLAAQLALLAAEYLAVFALCMGVSLSLTGLSVVRVALYFVLPLLIAGTGCAQIIRRTGSWDEISSRTGICEGYCICLAAVLIILYGTKSAAYENVGVWLVLTVCVFPVFILSIHMWVSESGEVSDKAGIINDF